VKKNVGRIFMVNENERGIDHLRAYLKCCVDEMDEKEMADLVEIIRHIKTARLFGNR
jgi:predicted house-cleaning noncanonical NTP pyrophosphatase (MazG superfamily)